MILVRVETTGICKLTSHAELSHVELQKAVGGNLQNIKLFCGCEDDGQIVAYCDEDGKMKNLQGNIIAQAKLSVLFNKQCPPIAGPIVLCRSEGGKDFGLTADDLMLIEGSLKSALTVS
jgi:hypothetical protein